MYGLTVGSTDFNLYKPHQCSLPRAVRRCCRIFAWLANGPTFFRMLRISPVSPSTGVLASRDAASAYRRHQLHFVKAIRLGNQFFTSQG
jgi:hypothetical protein